MMPRPRRLFVSVVVLLGAALVAWNGTLAGQSGALRGEWPTYGGDLASTRYSPLDQIPADNFNKLEVAWRFKTDALGPRPELNFQSTPLMVSGVVFTTAGSRRAVVALDAATGEMLWMHSEHDVRTGKRLWIFHTIPLPGEFGNESWEKDSWAYTGNAGVWAQMSIDEELGLAYLPVELPTGDAYGDHRPGAEPFGESLVAVDLQNGQRGAMLRAYVKATGAEVGAVYMPAPQTGSPMTYMMNGRQYIVLAISGGAYSGELLAHRLPS